MSYIDDNLLPGESVVYRAQLHWIVFFWPIFFLVLAVMSYAGDVPGLGGLCFLLALITSVSSAITFTTSEFGITNKRVLVMIGFIRRHSLETLLNKVEGVRVDQSILGRILDYGTIIITGTGGTKEPFHRISVPMEFRKRVQEQIASS